MQQTSVETIQEQIEHEISLLEMDFNSGVEWSMQIMHKSLKRIRNKALEAKAMNEEEIKNAYNAAYWGDVLKFETSEEYFNKTFKQ